MPIKHFIKTALSSILLSIVLTACASTQRYAQIDLVDSDAPLPLLNQSLFKTVPVIAPEAVLYLDDKQRDKFFRFLNDPNFLATPRHERVATYIGLILDQFTFSDKTLTTQQSLSTKSGNCLSLTLLTTAYANLAEVKVTYQLLDRNPIYNIDNNNLLVTSDHLRAVLHSSVNQNEDGFWSTSRIRIDYFQTDGLSYVDNIDTDFQLSLFYSNLAVEKLSRRELDSAFSYAEKALSIHKSNSSALNTIGIVHRKRGDLAKAEEIFLHGAKHFEKAPTFLRNYTAVLEKQSRNVDASLIESIATESDHDHPWKWVRAGKAAYNNGAYNQAVSYYQRALLLAPDLHQLYLLAGLASYAAGNTQQSHQHLTQAFKLANEPTDRAHYKRKLNAFDY